MTETRDITGREIVSAIMNGKMDDALDAISETIEFRREQIVSLELAGVGKGDRVEIRAKVRPRYLVGMVGVVEDIRDGQFQVRMERPMGCRKYVDRLGRMHAKRDFFRPVSSA